MHLLVPIAAAASRLVWNEEQLKTAKHEIELTKTLVEKLPGTLSTSELHLRGDTLTVAEGAGLRALRQTLLEKDTSRWFGGMRQVPTPSGDLLWVCGEHYREYDPGLPVLPD